MQHRLPKRISAHALICVIALVLYGVMRMRLKDADSKLSPERALEQLRRIQYHQVHLGGERRDGTASLSDADHAILEGLNLTKPAVDEQLALPWGHISLLAPAISRTYDCNYRTPEYFNCAGLGPSFWRCLGSQSTLRVRYRLPIIQRRAR